MDPLSYLKALRHRWVLVAALLAVGAAAAWVTAPAPRDASGGEGDFAASAIVVYEGEGGETAPTVRGRTSGGPNLDSIALLVTAGVVPERAAELVDGAATAVELASQVRTTTNPTLGTITITATAADRERTELLANTFAEQFVAYLDERTSQETAEKVTSAGTQLDNLEAQISAIEAQLVGAGADQGVLRAQRDSLVGQYRLLFDQFQQLTLTQDETAGFELLQRATAIDSATTVFGTPSGRTGRMAIGGIAGLVLGALLALVVDRIDTRIRTKEAAEEAFRLPVVAEIPLLYRWTRSRYSVTRPMPPAVEEAYRLLRTEILVTGTAALFRPALDSQFASFSSNGHSPNRHDDPLGPLRALLVTSANRREGKTTLVANLAAALGRTGIKAIAVDIDFGRPQLHDYFGVPMSPGAADLVEADDLKASLDDAIRPTEAPNVSLIPAGSAGGTLELLPRAPELVGEASDRADIVLIDAGPLLSVSDASELVPAVDGVLLACFSGRTTARAAARASERLARLGAAVYGVALIGTPRASLRRAYRPNRRLGGAPADPNRGAGHPETAPADPIGVPRGG
ncbi:MAG: hypothetical protein ACRD29_25530 [Acidimicrobiales bacterium]